jgi:hypothetical protein
VIKHVVAFCLFFSLADPVTAQITAPGTDYVAFWSGELRIFAQKPDTEVELIDVDTNAPLSPADSRITTFGAPSNPFVLSQAGDFFVGNGGIQSVNLEIRIRILTSDPQSDVGPVEDKPVTVWTGSSLDPNVFGAAWGSYIPASFSSGQTFGREIGRDFLGFTQRDIIVVAPRVPGTTTQLVIENLDDPADLRGLTLDGSIPTCPALANADPAIPVTSTPCYLLDHPELQAVYLNDYDDERLRITSNVDVSVLTGYRLLNFVASDTTPDFGDANWSASPPSFAAGDDGIELGTLFYFFVRSDLAVFPTQDDTNVTITDLSDADDDFSVNLASADLANSTLDVYVPNNLTATGTVLCPRSSNPTVLLIGNSDNHFDNDLVKVESDKPILIYQGPVGHDIGEYADVAFSVALGPQERLVYAYAQNFGESNDLQLFAFQRDTQVTITSLTTSFAPGVQGHDFVIDFDVPVGAPPNVTATPVGSQFVANPTQGDIQHFGSGSWRGELMRIFSTRPITVIAGDYDYPNFGAYIPFTPTGVFLPPTAILSNDTTTPCPGEAVVFDASGSFDQDSVGPEPDIVRFDWDFGDGVVLPDAGPIVMHAFSEGGLFNVQVTVTDNEASPNTQTDTDVVMIDVQPLGSSNCLPLSLSMDVRPRECPNYWAKGRLGFLSIGLLQDDQVHPSDVRLASLELRRADGIGGSARPVLLSPQGPTPSMKDVQTPFPGLPCGCHLVGPDGLLDLSLWFHGPLLLRNLGLNEEPNHSEHELVLSGQLRDGRFFEARDCIFLLPQE